ncbi:hypothetical protein FS749_008104 [Ceratobasidium sp. UAMH 11750]|nr:hypothetical protein FS749_008104 [Ceratobasidium sp. UAMH 11750]
MSSEITNFTSKSHQVFSIPELASLVSSFSATQDCARLLRTCKLLYEVALPYVWEHVDGALHLLGLLESVYVGSEEYLDEPYTEIALSNNFYRSNPFLRFNVYAPHVKSLDVYGRNRKLFKVKGWTVLISHARRRVLLPNLHTIILQPGFDDSYGPDQAMWIGAFASPSLVNLLITPSNPFAVPTVSYAAASFVLKHVTAHCPALQRLGLFPSKEMGGFGEEGESSFLAFLFEEPFYQYVAGVTGLRHLSGTLAWFEDTSLKIIGRLPHLETISIYSGFDEPGAHGELEMADDFFPALRRLEVFHLDPWDIERVIGRKPLLKNLTTFCLEMDMNRIDGDEEAPDQLDWLINDVFPCLANAPHLADLAIKVDPREESESKVYEIGESVLAILSGLPLVSLLLDNIVLSDEYMNVDPAATWPSLTRLQMPAHTASLAWLCRFATLPCLQHLELELDLENGEIVDTSNLTQPTLTTLVTGAGGAMCSGVAETDSVAR